MKKYFLISFISCALVACIQQPTADVSREPLLKVEGRFLYKDDLAQIIPTGTSAEDSTALADAFIRQWVTNVLLYENAKRNIANEAEIETMVEEYRKSLTIHYYQQRLVAQRLEEPSDTDVVTFYERYIDQFPLQENVLQGIFVKIPAGAPRIKALRKTLQNLDDDKDIQKIEDYCVKHAASYDYFPDKWIFCNDLFTKMPAPNMSQKAFLSGTTFYETADSTYIYLLKITDYRLAGMPAPVELVQEKIRTVMNNQRKLEYIKQFEASLYDDAVSNGQITFFEPLLGDKSIENDYNAENETLNSSDTLGDSLVVVSPN